MADRCLCSHRHAAHSGRTLGSHHMPSGCTACQCPGWAPIGTDWCNVARTAGSATITVAAFALLVVIGAPLWLVGAIAIGIGLVVYVWDVVDTRCVTGRWWWR